MIGAAILSATMHAVLLLTPILDFSFPFPAEAVHTFEVELIVVEPKVEKISLKDETLHKTSQELKNVSDEESARPIQTTTSSMDTVKTPSQSSHPRSNDFAKEELAPVEKESETDDKKEGKESLQSKSEPRQLAELAKLVDEERSNLQESLTFDEVLGCNAAAGATTSRSYIEQLAKSAKTGRSYAQIAVNAQMSGDYHRAIDLYDAAIRAGDLSRNNLAKVYNNRGAAYRNLGFSSLAIDDYNEAMRLEPDYAAAYFNRGVAYSLNDEKELAIGDFTRSIQLDSGFADPYYQRGIIYAQRAAHKQAISDFSRAIKLAPCLDAAYFARGRVLESIGELDRAIADFKKSYALDPNSKKYKAKLLSLALP